MRAAHCRCDERWLDLAQACVSSARSLSPLLALPPNWVLSAPVPSQVGMVGVPPLADVCILVTNAGVGARADLKDPLAS